MKDWSSKSEQNKKWKKSYCSGVFETAEIFLLVFVKLAQKMALHVQRMVNANVTKIAMSAFRMLVSCTATVLEDKVWKVSERRAVQNT